MGHIRYTKPRRDQAVRQEAIDACLLSLLDLRKEAEIHGLTVATSVSISSNGKRSLQLMFNHGVERVLNYWPGTLTWFVPLMNNRGTVEDAFGALRLAARESRRRQKASTQ